MSKAAVVNELHRSVRRNFIRRKTLIRGLNETFQADLVEMLPYKVQNKNYKYILTVIDIFSKYAWAIPLKSKNSKDVTEAMSKILATGRIPKNLHTDQGKEFFNATFRGLMKEYAINHYSTYSTKKAAIVERFNRTLKEKMWRAFSVQGSYKWLILLPKLLSKYNSTKHSTIKMRPIDVTSMHEKHLLQTVYKNNVYLWVKPKFSVNDYVRISKYKSQFAKGYTPNWTAEIFQVYMIQWTHPITYKIQDFEGNRIEGRFYEHELLKAEHPHVFLVEKVLKKKGNQVFVKWLGFPSKHNSWINKNKIL